MMVNKINKDSNRYYECKECKLIYKNEVWAEKCEKWCRKNKSCNLEITKHAIKNNG